MMPMSLPDAVALAGRLWPDLSLTAAEWAKLLTLMCQRPVASDEAATAVLRYAVSDDAAGEVRVSQEGR